MKKKQIHTITDVYHLTDFQYVSVMKEFIHLPCDDPSYLYSVADFNIKNTKCYRNLILKSEKWKCLTEVVQLKPKDLCFCFDVNHNFVCMRDQVKFSNHDICLPASLNLGESTVFSFTDKCSILYQLSSADENSMLELNWYQLCTPQMMSIAQFLGLNLTFTQIQNSQNPSNFIEAKCRQSRSFRENYGSGSTFKFATFSFCLEDILNTLGISLNFPSIQQSEEATNVNSIADNLEAELASLPGGANLNLQPDISDESLGLAIVNSPDENSPVENSPDEKSSEEISSDENSSEESSSEYSSALVNKEHNNVNSSFEKTNPDGSSSSLYDTGSSGKNHTKPMSLNLRSTLHNASVEISYDSAIEFTKPISQSTPLMSAQNKSYFDRKVKYSSNPILTCDSLELSRSKNIMQRTSRRVEGGSLTDLDSSDDESTLEKQILVDNELVIQLEPSKRKHIINDSCLTCQKNCKNATLKCYVCQRKVHFSCYKSQETKPLSEEDFIRTLDLNSHKWFCNKCSTLSLNDILAHATERIRLCIQKSCDFLGEPLPAKPVLDPDNYDEDEEQQSKDASNREVNCKGQQMALHYSDISEACSAPKIAVSGQSEILDTVVQKINQCISSKISELKDFITDEVILPQKKTYADITLANQPSEVPTAMGAPRHPNSVPKVAPQSYSNIQSSSKVNKLNSLVIRNIQDRNFIKDAPSIKKEFNKYFKLYKLVSAFPTRSGALILELPTQKEAEHVEKNWKSSFFCPENKLSHERYQTSCKIMANIQNPKVIVRDVEYGISDDRMTEHLCRKYPEAAFQRFVTRQGKFLRTGIITLKNTDQLTELLEIGHVNLCNQHLSVEKYIPKRKVVQCFSCKQFDHVSKWCPNAYSCGNCSKGHRDDECRTPNQLRCINCKGTHSSVDKSCPAYIHKCEINNALLVRDDE